MSVMVIPSSKSNTIRPRRACPAEMVSACCHARSVWRWAGVRRIVREVLGVSHLLHTWRPSYLRAVLYKLGNVEGEVLHRLIDLNVVLPGCCRPDPVVVFLQSAEQPHPRLGVGPTPVLPHTLFPQIPQGLLPVVVKEGENLLEMLVVNRVDLLAQLFEFELRLGFAVRMVEDIHQLSDHTAEAVDKTLLLSFYTSRGFR